jgi:hypothetical protein
MKYSYHKDGSQCPTGYIFVFGSNLAGVHGAGAAKYAFQELGAIWTKGVGIHGNSYALPTKDRYIQSLSLEEIKKFVNDFCMVAREHPKNLFYVTRVGCVLAGYSDYDIAPMFRNAPSNCNFAEEWMEFLE